MRKRLVTGDRGCGRPARRVRRPRRLASVGVAAARRVAQARRPARSRSRSRRDPGSLDPQLTLLGAARYVDAFAYDTLVNLVGPGKIASGLAQSWKVVSPKKVQFTLHRGDHVLRRHADDRVGGQAEPRLRRQPGEQVAAARGVHADGAKTVGERQRSHRRRHDETPNPFMLQGLALVQIVCSQGLADRWLARAAARSGAARTG